MKTIIKIISSFLFLIILLGVYLSIFGVETTKFNKQIQDKIKKIDSNLNLDLKKVKLVLNPLDLSLSAKTIGPKIIKQNKYLELENIETHIALKALLNNEFLIKQVEISTKSIEISELISFARSFYPSLELIIFEKLFNIKGYVISNIQIEFNENGSIKDNYTLTGFIKDTKVNLSKNNNLTKLNLDFEITKDNINFKNINFKLNNLDFVSKVLSAKKINDEYLVEGKIENKTAKIDYKYFIFLKELFIPGQNIKNVKFNSNSEFSLKINDKLQLKDIKIISKINIKEAQILKRIYLKGIFPEIKNEITFLNHEINLNYRKDFLSINGKGKIFL